MEVIKNQVLSCGQKYELKRNVKCTNGKTIVDVHSGVDIISKTGDKNLLALADGKVLYTTNDDGTGSKTIVCAYGGVLPYGFVLLALYAHCDSFSKSKGQIIKKGEKVATIGATGNVTGVHCHCSMYAIPPKTWHTKDGKWYSWDYKTRDQYEIDPNELLHLY